MCLNIRTLSTTAIKPFIPLLLQMMFLLTLTTLSMVSLTQATCSLSSVKDNMVATRLEGNWTFNADFSRLLSTDETKAPIGEVIVSYTNDPSVLDDIPEDNCGFLEKSGMEIYLAGTLQFMHVELGIISHTYVLSSSAGVPVIIYWQGVNAVTNLVQVAPAILPQNDLLFMGEDSADKPFSVLERIGTKLGLCGVEGGDKTPRQ